MTEDLRAKYAERINALLAKAENTSHSAEAEAFSRKAEELMIKWGIEQAHLEAAAKGKDATKIEQITVLTLDFRGDYHHANMSLANYVFTCMATSNKTIMTERERGYTQLRIVGFASDLDRGHQLLNSLLVQCEDAYKQWWKIERGRVTSYTGMERFKIKRQFIVSFGSAVGARLLIIRNREIRVTAGTDLVLANRDKRVEDEFSNLYPVTRSINYRMKAGTEAAEAAGHQAGRNASFSRGAVTR